MRKIISSLLVLLLLSTLSPTLVLAKESPKFIKDEFAKAIQAYSNEDLSTVVEIALLQLNKNKFIDNDIKEIIISKLDYAKSTNSKSENKSESVSKDDLKKLYQKFDYKAYMRNPEKFKDVKYLLTGKINYIHEWDGEKKYSL